MNEFEIENSYSTVTFIRDGADVDVIISCNEGRTRTTLTEVEVRNLWNILHDARNIGFGRKFTYYITKVREDEAKARLARKLEWQKWRDSWINCLFWPWRYK